jgi:hypothetical protein
MKNITSYKTPLTCKKKNLCLTLQRQGTNFCLYKNARYDTFKKKLDGIFHALKFLWNFHVHYTPIKEQLSDNL